ncbi:hypothetical protein KC19_3G033700 [Ceratodon purpureus]|uniref:Late embryogenesis abundant protein LEA-2 subgroup domain-containing protein n=1 Tax=Ceratodon purpureus TaxID=3225 RepID=A0A8T0IGF2_CERPU|nr:hypothetical protein KC19_3G033700 [Ceratodon purpureus]
MGEKREFEKVVMSPNVAMEERALKPQAVPVYKRRKCRVCCGVCLVVLVALGIVAVVLSQTIFKFRDPKVTLNDVKLQNISFNFDLAQLATILNISLSADVRVDNPNYYDFRYSDSKLVMVYHSDQVGVVELGAGTIRSRKTVDLPAVITVEAVRLLVNSLQDITSNVMSLNLNSALSGRVNLARIYKKHVTAILNCTMDVFISNTSLKEYDCKQTIKL